MSKNLREKTEKWFIDRNLHTANPVKQFEKLMEESGELFEGIAKGKADLIQDALGDMQVVLIGLKLQLDKGNMLEASPEEMDLLAMVASLGDMADKIFKHIYQKESGRLDLGKELILVQNHIRSLAIHNMTSADDCLAIAYEEIKDRKGKMIDGVFVKEEDLND